MPVQFTTTLPDAQQPSLDTSVEDEITVSWTDVIDNGEYRVEYRKTSASSWTLDGTYGQATTSTTITGLDDGEEYEVQMRTETAHVTGSWTTPVSGTTVLPAASGVSASATADDITVSWTGEIDNGTYRIYRKHDGGSYSQLGEVGSATTSYDDTALLDGEEYTYYIESYTEHTSTDSATASAITELPTPGSPAISVTADDVSLSWTDTTDNGGYKVYRTHDGNAYSEIADLSGTATSYNDTGLLDGEEYTYYIQSYTEHVTSDTGTLSEITALPAPTTLSESNLTNDTVDLSWTNNHDNGSVSVQFKQSDSATWQDFTTGLSLTTESDTVTGLLDGEQYDTRILAVTEHTQSASSIVQLTTVLPDVGQPNLNANNEDELDASWSNVIDNGEYQLEYRETGATTWITETTITNGSSSYTLSSLEDGEEYEIRIRTQTAHKTGIWTSPIADVTILPDPTSIGSTYTTGEIEVTWSHGADHRDGYKIYRSEKTPDGWSDFQQLDDLGPNDTNYIDDNIAPSRIYEYRFHTYTEHVTSSGNIHQTDQVPAEIVCGRGGVIYVLGEYEEVYQVKNDENWAHFGDVRLDSDTDLTLNLDGQHDIEAKVEHITGDAVMRFGLHARQPNATADVRLNGLSQESFYRFQFDGILAETETGRAHGETTLDGTIQYNKVRVPQ